MIRIAKTPGNLVFFGAMLVAGSITAGCAFDAAGPNEAPSGPISSEAESNRLAPQAKSDEGVNASGKEIETVQQGSELGTTQQAITSEFFPSSVSIDVWGGSDYLGSKVWVSFQRGDGTWSSEKLFTDGLGANVLKHWSWHAESSGDWDGIDPCAKQIRFRMERDCTLFWCSKWEMQVRSVAFRGFSFSGGALNEQMLGGQPTHWMDQDTYTITLNRTQPGIVCGGPQDLVSDCDGDIIPLSIATAWMKDSYCDNNAYSTRGIPVNLNCGPFQYDNGACGKPSGWTCPDGYYNKNDGCDCNCGVWDPDCDRPNYGGYVYGCSSNRIGCSPDPVTSAPICLYPIAVPR